MNATNLKDFITEANRAYRVGRPIMSDQKFDDLLDELKGRLDPAEFETFRRTLSDPTGKVRHPFVMGSLNKYKAEEPDTVVKFCKANLKTRLNISAKVDGISCRLHYADGRLTSASTRGDGENGEDISDKIHFVKGIPEAIPSKYPQDIRGELVILTGDFDPSMGKNPRNVCAGVMNRKDWKKEDVAKITFVPYTILGGYFTKYEQFKKLREFGFEPAWNVNADVKAWEVPDRLAYFMKEIVPGLPYECDGLVFCDCEYRNEDKYYPDACGAYKTNQLVAETRIVDVAWDGPSSYGTFCPVAIIDPVELGGAVISRVTMHNLDFIAEGKYMIGSKVEMVKSGDIIPKLVKNLGNDDSCVAIEPPDVCPVCGGKIVRDGVNVACVNQDCPARTVMEVESFIKKLGCMGASRSSLEAFGIRSMADILPWRPSMASKAQTKFYGELRDKMFSRSKQELLAAMPIRDVGSTLVNRIVEKYGYDKAVTAHTSDFWVNDLPAGIGAVTMEKFAEGLRKWLPAVGAIAGDSRYSGTQQVSRPVQWKGSVCFTGALNTMGRTEAQKLAEKAGYRAASSVSKGLTYLVTNDKNSGSSKNKKAQQLGVKIIDEQEFIKLVKPDASGMQQLDLF